MEHTPTLCRKGINIPISFCRSLASSSDLKRQPSELCEHPHFCPAEFEARQTCLFGRSGSHCCRRHIAFFTRDSRVAFSKLMQRPVKNGERASERASGCISHLSRDRIRSGRHRLFRAFQASRCYVTQHPLQKAIHLTVRERERHFLGGHISDSEPDGLHIPFEISRSCQ